MKLGFLLVNIRHKHSFEEKKRRKNLNKSDGRYSIQKVSVPSYAVTLGKHKIYTYIFKGHLVFLQLQGCYGFSVIIMVCICANNVTIVAGIPYNFLLS